MRPPGQSNAIQFENVYIANDETNLYIRFTLYAPALGCVRQLLR
jgi:hypothetical protein